MGDNILDITRLYRDGEPLTKAKLDEAFDDIKSWADIEVKNRKQMALDMFSIGYAFDNDGVRNLSRSLQDQMRFPEQFEMYFDFNEEAGVLAASDYNDIYWGSGGSNGSVTVREDANGVVRIATTAATADPYMEYRHDIVNTLLNPELEFYCKVDDITNLELYLGFYTDTNNYCYFKFDSATSANNIYAVSKTSAGEVVEDTGIDFSAGTYFKFRILIDALTDLKFYINNTQVCTAFAGLVASSSTIKPRFWVKNKSSAVRLFDLDYVRFRQDRNIV
jgi:hypothetical protein